MNKHQIKIKIYVLQTIDWLMIIGLIGGLYLAYTKGIGTFWIAVMGLVGLGVIHQVGLLSVNQIHKWRINIEHIEHDEKQKEIQDLMSKGGQKVKKRS